MVRALAVLALSLALAGCGPKTVVSMFFPTRYAVTTVVDFDDGGQVTRQTVVTGCKVTDQTDSIAKNVHTEVTGERHWLRRADGSLWVVGILEVCRWGPKGPRGDRDTKPFAAEVAHEAHDRLSRVPMSYTYHFDDAADPAQVEIYDTSRLFVEGARGLSLSGQLAAGGGKPTDTLRAAFPFLAHADARAAEIMAANKDKSYAARAAARATAPSFPGSFIGFRATAHTLRNTSCPAPDPEAAGPILLDSNDQCQFHNVCRERLPADKPCKEPLGGLRPTFAPDYGEVRYSLDDRDRAFEQTLVRQEVLRAAGAPYRQGPGTDWNPEICIDGLCQQRESLGGLLLYYPKRKVIVEVWSAIHQASGRLFLAEEGPRWSGRD